MTLYRGLTRCVSYPAVFLLVWTVLSGSPGRAQTGQYVPGRILVQFRPEVSDSQARGVAASLGARSNGQIPQIGVHIVSLPAGASETAYVRAFQQRPEVVFAETDRILPPAAITPNDPWYASWEWHLPKISAPTAWATTTGSSSIIIAIIDTGVDGTHEDLAAKMVAGWNVYDNNSDSSDVYGHGTEVAGTAAAASNNGLGVASVAWGCWVMPVRVSDTGGYATYSNIATGIAWAADHGARVANVSYIVSESSTVTSAATYLQGKGGVLAASAGNYSTFSSSADNPYILTVSATDSNDALYSWSNTGNNIDLAAPGCVMTTRRGGGYGSGCGTSFSAPIVAGVAALVLSANPALSGAQVTSVLQQSADDIGPAGWDSSFGWGRVNAARAVSLAGGGTSDTQAPSEAFASPTAGATVSGTVTTEISATDNVGVTSVSVYRDGTLLCTLTATPYTCTWNTSSSANGSHTLTATAKDAAGNASSASVSVMVSNVSDTTAPSVTITSPVSGSTVSGNVSVYASTSDNVGVVKVELYVDGALTATATKAPLTTKWNTQRAKAGAHTLQLKAYDAAGNRGVSTPVTVYK